MTQLRDLTGQKFERLTVLHRAEDYVQKNGRKRTQWKCICDCQKGLENPQYTYVTSDRLLSGNTKSCGCIRIEYQKSRNKNYFQKKDNYYIGFTNKNEPFYFDEEHYSVVKQYCWLTNKEGYIIAFDYKTNKQIWLHRLCLGLTDDDLVLTDHIHGKNTRHDNRKSNLRLATASQNGMNIGLRKHNTSGITGVSYDKKSNMYQVYLCKENNNHFLGKYANIEDAIKIRKQAEEKYFGTWSYENSMSMDIQAKENL